MRRRLLLQCLAVFGVMSASAYENGEYIYTPDSRYKAISANQVTNGDFSNQFAGWTNGSDDASSEPATSAWRLVTEVGPNGETVAESLSDGSGNAMGRIWTVSELGGAGLYVYSYYISGGTTTGNTSNVNTSANCVNFYVNQDGTFATVGRTVADVAAFNEDWTLVSDTVQLNQGDFFVMFSDRMAVGARITGVSINKVNQVFDDRLLEAKKEYFNTVFAGPWENTESVEETKEYLEEYYEILAETDDMDEANSYMAELDGVMDDFFYENSADMKSSFTHWYNSTKYQKTSKIGDWELTGGRWYHCNNVYTEEAMQTIDSEMPRSYDMPSASAFVTKSWEPGTYMLKMDVKGYYMLTGTSSQYDADLNSTVMGCTLVGNDVVKDISPLNTRNYKSEVIFFTIPEDQANVDNNIKFGFDFTIPEDEVGKKRGGTIYLSNLEMRCVNKSQAEIDLAMLVKNIATAQNGLKVMIDSANVVAKKTDIYKWGMAQMADSTAKGQAEYEASLLKVDAEGNNLSVVYEDDLTYPTTLNNYMSIVRKGMQNVYGYCDPYFNLNKAVEEAEAQLADPVNANGDATLKANVNTLIAEAKALSATYAVLEDDEAIQAEMAKYTEKTTALEAALAAYLATTASYENPAIIGITNGDFATQSTSGWTFTANDTSKENFKNTTNVSLEAGNGMQVWRGNTVSPNSMLKQNVTLKNKGLYVYTSSAMAHNDGNAGYDLGMATFIEDENGVFVDTVYTGINNQVRLFFGPEGAADSIRVHSRKLQFSGNTPVVSDVFNNYDSNGNAVYLATGYIYGAYTIFVEKTDDTEATYELGMSTFGQKDQAGANTYGFGDNVVSFLGGDVAKAVAAFKADVDAQLAEAQKVLDANAEPEYGGLTNAVSRLSRRLADAKALAAANPTTMKELTALANATNYAVEMAEDVDHISTGINTVSVEVVKSNIANGVYNMAGVRVANDVESLNALPKGLYIFNGKKYVVK